jgi:hypothetical protein
MEPLLKLILAPTAIFKWARGRGYVVDLVHKSSSTSDMLAGPGDLYDAMRSWPKVELLFAYQLVIQS